MTTLYWALEYGKVLFAYVFVFFIWPSVVFAKLLRGKSFAFKFGFCVTGQVVVVNGLVLLLGLCHILFQPLFAILFYATFLVQAFRLIPNKKELVKKGKRIMSGTLGMKGVLASIGKEIVTGIKEGFRRFMLEIEGHVVEFVLMVILMIFAMIYFTYGAFQDFSYGFGDMYPHNAWIYELTQGQIFSAGVYPEGMHCFLYAFHTLFGIKIYSCLLFTQGIHVVVFFLSAYILLRELFTWKYTPQIVIAAFLTWDVVCIDGIYAMSRLQWTLPQEFALYTVFLCGAFLIRYLKQDDEVGWLPENKKERNKILWKNVILREDLLVFTLALAASIIIHFYPTIMAFFVCVAIVPIFLKKIFYPRRFLALCLVIFLGSMIAIIPMLGALASGIPFQGSIGWALGVMTGELDSSGNVPKKEEATPTVDEETSTATSDSNAGEIITSQGGQADASSMDSTPAGEEQEAVVQPPKDPITVRAKRFLTTKIKQLSDCGYVTLYRPARGKVIELMTIMAFILFVCARIGATIYRLRNRDDEDFRSSKYDGYFSILLISVIYMCIYGAEGMHLPTLIAGSRVFTILHMMILAVCLIPLDFLMDRLITVISEKVEMVLGAVAVFGVYGVMQVTGSFHGYLYYELTRYNSAVMVTNQIVDTLPKNSYTVVSTVDELYQLIGNGYHEELVTFVNECVENQYMLPTEYVFIYLEKKPLKYAQNHFFEGPSWLAKEKYTTYYSNYVSQCPDIVHGDMNPEFANPPFFRFPASSAMYSDLISRMVLESRAYSWCQEFDKLYPGEMHTYYEDDDFVCYYFKQNPACLYQLGFQTREESEKK